MIYVCITLMIGFVFSQNETNPYAVVLGTSQDGGIPHANCLKKCCKDKWEEPKKIKVSCLGIVDPISKKSWIIDATPDFPVQHHIITKKHDSNLEGIFLTHAQIGHYTGLIHLGKEVMGEYALPIFVMPKMKIFLEKNGPWNQLVFLNNIYLIEINNSKEIKLSDQLFIRPISVPNRNEYSETVGYQIMGPNKSLLFIPDIDKWEKWDQDIIMKIKHVDYALVDGTFFSKEELSDFDITEVHHPFIDHSMEKFSILNTENRKKIYFIHLNHTNPAIYKSSSATNIIKSKRFNVAREDDLFRL